MDECDMEESGGLKRVERKRSPPYEIDGGHRRRNRKEIGQANSFMEIFGKSVMSAQMLEVSLFEV